MMDGVFHNHMELSMDYLRRKGGDFRRRKKPPNLRRPVKGRKDHHDEVQDVEKLLQQMKKTVMDCFVFY